MRVFLLLITICLTGEAFGAGPWFKRSNFGGEARHRATGFAIGNEGYMGLGHTNAALNVDYEDFWKYDPASDSWSQIANFAGGKCFHATAFVVDNKAYVGLGRLTTGVYTNQMYCYDATLNTWTAIAVFPGAARRGAVAFTVNGKGYVGTGQSGAGYTSDFFEYNPGTNSWAPKAALPATPRTSSIGFAIGNYGYVGTGDSNSGSTNDFYRYDPATNTWTVRASVGLVTRQEACGFAVNGKGYIGTGDDYSSGNNYGDFWEYDPLTDQWIQIPDFDGTARRYLCSFVIGNRAYVGTGTNGTNFRDFWLYDKILGLLQEQMLNVDPVVYPNPTTDHVTIDIKNLPEGVSSDQLDVQIIDLTGKLYSNESFVGTKANVDSKELPNGVYMIRLNYNGEPFYTTKIIKE